MNNNKSTLSVAIACSDAISKEFYLKELINSVWDIADEIIVVDGDRVAWDGETEKLLINEFFSKRVDSGKMKVFWNPWENRLGCIQTRLQKSIAISHCTSDYILLMDADEILFEEDQSKILDVMKLGHLAYSTRTIHGYRDFNHIKTGQDWYNYRSRLFKNNNFIFDSHDSMGGYNCGLIIGNMHDNESKRSFMNLSEHPDCKKTSIRIYHAGHIRNKNVYVKKKNWIEKSYHPNWKDIKTDEFEWDMKDTIKYEGNYPKTLTIRIEQHKEKYPNYYE